MADIVGPEFYRGRHRTIAQRLKDPYDREARQLAAPAMAQLIPPGEKVTFVPAPSSDGHNQATQYLASEIMSEYNKGFADLPPLQRITQAANVLPAVARIAPVPSSLMLRKAGKRGLTAAEHVPSLAKVKEIPEDRHIVVVDNVGTTGATIHAIEYVLGRPVKGLVYAVAPGSRGVRATAEESEAEEPSMGARRRRAPARTRRKRRPRLCITGSRDYVALERVGEYLDQVPRDVIIVHGGAHGVDEEAHYVAEELGFDVEVVPADWERYGRAAGPIRNREMVETCDHVVAFWNGISRGTESAIKAARDLGMEVDIIPDQRVWRRR